MATEHNGLAKTTSYKVVLPFYAYSAFSFLVATALLVLAAPAFTQHYFHPQVLAITHIMTLGWGTMTILGASHQLVPVLIEGKLYSDTLALLSFALAAIGIPMLVYGFYVFNMGDMAQWGGELVVTAVLLYFMNLVASILKSKKKNIQALFVLTATIWLLITVSLGLLLVFNFNSPILTKDSFHYVSLHAHLGVAGWFLFLIVGVGSRLIPMFLISKYDNKRLLRWIYFMLNAGLISFAIIFIYSKSKLPFLIPLSAIGVSVLLFLSYCRQAYRQRLRRKVDEQMSISLLSVLMMLIPLLMLMAVVALYFGSSKQTASLVFVYGFSIFFGWITALIFGMTFKTLPFIVWNKVYYQLAGKGKTPNPKDLFSSTLFRVMSIAYIIGFVLFSAGILLKAAMLLQVAATLLFLSAVLYNWNVIGVLTHRPVLR